MKKIIYLDNNSTTPIAPEILEYTSKLLGECFGNASSTHLFGWQAKEIVEKSRVEVAKLIGTDPECVIFTSGATESNNMVLQGFCQNQTTQNLEEEIHIISSKIEHSSVLKTIYHLNQKNKVPYSLLENDSQGKIKKDALQNTIQEIEQKKLVKTLISIQLANNEIGTIQDLDSLLNECNEKEHYFHSDITQGIGKIPFSFKKTPLHAISFSGHKFHAPKGIGVLAFRDQEAMKKISPICMGGAQEKGLRSGTLAVPFIGSIGLAAQLAGNNFDRNKEHLITLTELLLKKITSFDPTIKLQGPSLESERRLPGNLNILIPGINGGKLCSDLATSVACSTGSACLATSTDGSAVLKAIGLEKAEYNSVIRIGISIMNTEDEILTAAEKIIAKIKKSRGI